MIALLAAALAVAAGCGYGCAARVFAPARDPDRERAGVQEPDDAIRARRQADPGRHRRARRPRPSLGRRGPAAADAVLEGEITGFTATPIGSRAPARPTGTPSR